MSDAVSDISQIEALKLPKRADKRRRIYLGENITCVLISRQFKMPVDVIDISFKGLAVVDAQIKRQIDIPTGAPVELAFGHDDKKNSFSIKGFISNISITSFSDKKYLRLGIKFDLKKFDSVEDYTSALPSTYYTCKGFIRPQASCHDPFFYNEIVLFQVNGFTIHGIDFSVSARCKSMLPGQKLAVDIYIPGRGTFPINIKNSQLFYLAKNDNRYRLYSEFIDPSTDFLEAVSEYLVMFSEHPTPKILRSKGFKIGNLANAIEISYAHLSEDILETNNLQPSVISIPRENGSKTHTRHPFARTLTCKLGPHIVSTCLLVFVEADVTRSVLESYGYTIPKKLLAARHLELINLYISNEAVLVDFLIPLLQHVVRIGAQSRAEFIVLEASEKICPVLEKIGFTAVEHDNQKTKPISHAQLMQLAIRKIVTNTPRTLSAPIWDKIYKKLYHYLQDNPQFLRIGSQKQKLPKSK